jgi:hypothetical protein
MPIKLMEDIMKLRFVSCTAVLTASVYTFFSTPLIAAPVFSELFYDASGSDAGLVLVELFGAPGEILDGLVLEGVNSGTGSIYTSVSLSGVIPGDAVGYGSFRATDIFAGEGGAAADSVAGSSIARDNPVAGSNDNSVDFIALTDPTPGSVPVVSSVPVPAAVWLFGSGLMAMTSIARRRW